MSEVSPEILKKWQERKMQNKPLTKEEVEERMRKIVLIEIKLIDKNNTLAAANLTLMSSVVGQITIKGFLIFRSSKKNPVLEANINIAAPSRLYFGKYHPQVFISQKERWDFLQVLIYEKYLTAKKVQFKEIV